MHRPRSAWLLGLSLAAVLPALTPSPARAQRGQTIEIDLADDVQIRVAKPPQAYDEKGRPRKYTNQELKELKGPDPKLPGYTGDLDSLAEGKAVQVRLARPKDAGKPKDGDADSKPAKVQMVSAGSLTGQIVRTGNRKGKGESDGARTMTLRVLGGSLTGSVPRGKSPLEGVRATLVLVVN